MIMNSDTKNWSFTWETNIKQKKLPERTKLSRFLNSTCKKSVFQIELGKRRKKRHYQGGLILEGPRISKKQLLKSFENNFKNVAGLTLQKAHNIEAVMKYSSKSDTRLEGPFIVGQAEVWDEEYANAILRDWQKRLWGFLKKNSSNKIFRDRKILWIQDTKGAVGKSFMQKWLRIGQSELKARKLPVSSVERLISAVTKVLDLENNKIDIFMVNITKSRGREESFGDLLAAVEQLKDGYIVSTMYGRYVEAVFKPPIILIFTNESFQDHHEGLTDDRWLPVRIENDKKIEVLEYDHEGFCTPFEIENYEIK